MKRHSLYSEFLFLFYHRLLSFFIFCSQLQEKCGKVDLFKDKENYKLVQSVQQSSGLLVCLTPSRQ